MGPLMKPQAIAFIWREVDIADADGVVSGVSAMVPMPRYRNVAQRQFVSGTEYILDEANERSMVSHNAYFAALHDYFENIPEKLAPRWPNEMTWRRWLLIECGWYDEKEFNVQTERDAKALATFVRTHDAFARISVHGKKVIVRTAKSQSMKAMGKDDFLKSKNDVLDLAGEIVGVSRTDALRNAGHAA